MIKYKNYVTTIGMKRGNAKKEVIFQGINERRRYKWRVQMEV